jgi:hypothetical protein
MVVGGQEVRERRRALHRLIEVWGAFFRSRFDLVLTPSLC